MGFYLKICLKVEKKLASTKDVRGSLGHFILKEPRNGAIKEGENVFLRFAIHLSD